MSLVGFSRIGAYTLPSLTGSHSDFVVYLKYDDFHADVLANLDDGGGDLRFSSDESGTTQLPCEVVQFDKTGNTIQVWVKIPTASTGQVIYIWGDNTGSSQPDVTDTYGRNSVWNNHDFVTHLGDPSTVTDSTGNDSAASTVNSGVSLNEQGKLGTGASINSTYGGIMPTYDTPHWSSEFTTSSISAWVKLTGDQDGPAILMAHGGSSNGQALGYRVTPDLWCYSVGMKGSTTEIRSVSEDIVDADWMHVRGVVDNGTTKLYINGIKESTGTLSNTTSDTNSSPPAIGSESLGGSTPFNGEFPLDGIVDEARKETTVHSDDFYLTEYQNQSSIGSWGTMLPSVVSNNEEYLLTGGSAITVNSLSTLGYNKNYVLLGNGEVVLNVTTTPSFQTNSKISGVVEVTLSSDIKSVYNQNTSIIGSGELIINSEGNLSYSSGNSIIGATTVHINALAITKFNNNRSLVGNSTVKLVSTSSMKKAENRKVIGFSEISVITSSSLVYKHGGFFGSAVLSFSSSSKLKFNTNKRLIGKTTVNLTGNGNQSYGLERILLPSSVVVDVEVEGVVILEVSNNLTQTLEVS